jgi:hypothetical protein
MSVRGAVQNAVPAIQTAAAVAGTIFAFSDARDLYGQRDQMASQFQQQSIFPADLIQNNRSFYMSFQFQKYEKRAINNSPFLRSQGTVRLPIPNNLKDNMNVSYGSPSLSGAVGAGLEQVVAGGQNQSFETVAGSLGTAAAAGAAAIGGAAAQFIQGTGIGQAAQAYFGLAVNPYQTILFEKPEFKKHSFSWRMIPKNERESSIIRDILRTFQYHMSPGVSGAGATAPGLFFSYPSMVTVSLYPSSEFLYRFKPCVLQNVSIDYAPGSSPSFYKRTPAAPTVVNVTINLLEIEYWTNKDFTADQFSDIRAQQEAFLRTQVNTITPGSNRGTSGI